jgi:hypothetical protein
MFLQVPYAFCNPLGLKKQQGKAKKYFLVFIQCVHHRKLENKRYQRLVEK